MAERITISLDRDGVLEIFLNEAGRDQLVAELQRLDWRSDHFHLAAGDLGEVALQSVPYRESDKLIDTAKIMLRPDDWDRQYFPHVTVD